MPTKLLHTESVYQHIEMSNSHWWALTRHTGITLHDTSTSGDFMLLANTGECNFLKGCGLDLSDICCDYFIVHMEKWK